MGKTVERNNSALSINEIASMLAKYKCGHIRRTQLEQTVGLPLSKIERRTETVFRARLLERR